MKQVVFSEAARRDRQEITAYTVEHFGVQQARRLRERFEAILNSFVESPLIGHVNPELDPPGHSFRYCVVMKRFIIFYELTDTGIRVARLMHAARHLASELAHDAGDDQ